MGLGNIDRAKRQGADPGGEAVLRRMYRRSMALNLIGALTIMINPAADGMMIGHFLGTRAAAAFGLVIPFYSLVNLLTMVLRTAAQARIGTLIGMGDLKGVNRTIYAFMVRAIVFSVPFILMLTVFRHPLMFLLGVRSQTSPEIAGMVSDYLLYYTPAAVPMLLSPILHPLMQYDGDSRRGPTAIFCGTLVNLACDYINVQWVHGGMAGIAAATVLSAYTELAVLAWHFARQNSVFKPQRGGGGDPGLRSAFASSVPVMLRELSSFVTGILLNMVAFALAGEGGWSVLAAGNSMLPFLISPVTALSNTGISLGMVSQGESDDHAVDTILRTGLWYAAVPCTVIGVLFAFASGPIAHFIAGSDPVVMDMTRHYLIYMSLCLPLIAVCQVTESHLVVKGKTVFPTVIGLLDGGVGILITIFLLGLVIGKPALWLGLIAGDMLAAAPAVIAVIRNFRDAAVRERDSRDAVARERGSDQHYEMTARTTQEAAEFSQIVKKMCEQQGLPERVCYVASLSAEEMACNIIEWGFSQGGVPGVDLRIAIRDGHVTLRFRDNGRKFDPKRYAEQFVADSDDMTKNYGLRMITGMVSDMQYTCLVDCNLLLITI